MTTSRRTFLSLTGGGAAATWLGCGQGSAPDVGARKPNVVMIMSDDLGYEAIQAYGGTSYATPRIDELAATGMRFEHAYAQPLCTPTRIQLMTGQYNYRNWLAFGIMPPNEHTFGHQMQAAGYKTCISGKWQLTSYNPPSFEPEFRGLGMKPEDAGFDEWFLWHAGETEVKGSRYGEPTVLDNGTPVANTDEEYGPDLYVDYINGFMERNRDEPFFVYYPMALTHGPFNPTPGSEEWDAGDRLENDPKFFGDMVEHMDTAVGRVIDKIDELGLREDTIIIFYSDNGSPLETSSMMGDLEIAGGKGAPTDAGTRVPLVVNWKGTTVPGQVVDDLADSTDLYATILDIGGAEGPTGQPVDGVSLLPLIRGEEGSWSKDVIVCWHDPRPGAMKESFTHLDLWARDQRFKLYDDGRLYDVPSDVLEQHPFSVGEGSAQAEAARVKLRASLDEIPAHRRDPEWDPYTGFERMMAEQ
jgi:arylsulfatase A